MQSVTRPNDSPTTTRRPLAGASVGIPPRNLKFRHDYLAETRYPVAGNAFATAVIGVLSGMFPPGERFFVESVRHFRDQVTDPVLQAQIAGFIGQEALHGREHDKLNALFLDRGIRVDIAEKVTALGLKALERLSPKQQLACTVFMEHFTAIFGESFLESPDFRQRIDGEVLKMWTWHALEELEHKSVAYDVYAQVSNSRLRRLLAGPLVTAAVGPGFLIGLLGILASDGQLQATRLRDHLKGAALFFGRRGLLRHIPRRLPDFFQRDFHPAQDNTEAIEARWRETLFGAQALLAAEGSRALH